MTNFLRCVIPVVCVTKERDGSVESVVVLTDYTFLPLIKMTKLTVAFPNLGHAPKKANAASPNTNTSTNNTHTFHRPHYNGHLNARTWPSY